jgi:hypothetical protein
MPRDTALQARELLRARRGDPVTASPRNPLEALLDVHAELQKP